MYVNGIFIFFFFNDTATTEIYTLSLHDALPISVVPHRTRAPSIARPRQHQPPPPKASRPRLDRKSTRLNSSHSQISYAVFCLKKKKTKTRTYRTDHFARGHHNRESAAARRVIAQ